jgi:hypothetical protein
MKWGMAVYREPARQTHPFEYVLIGIILGAGVAFALTYYTVPSKTVTSYYSVPYTVTQVSTSTFAQTTSGIKSIKNPSFVVTSLNLTIGMSSSTFIIILQNVGDQPIVSLSAVVNTSKAYNVQFSGNVNGSQPLNPGQQITVSVVIPNDEVQASKAYPVIIKAIFSDGSEQVQHYFVVASI